MKRITAEGGWATIECLASAEHLAAIMVQTGRAKDRLRLEMLASQGELEHGLLTEILKRHGLMERYRSWM